MQIPGEKILQLGLKSHLASGVFSSGQKKRLSEEGKIKQ